MGVFPRRKSEGLQDRPRVAGGYTGVEGKGESLGFVPTMGCLHRASLLVERSRRENDKTVVSIFVNPLQFGPKETSPSTLEPEEEDRRVLEQGADLLFLPRVEEIYPPGFQTYCEVTQLTKPLCGLTREGHFRGVTTVVLKLFNIVSPQRAYFGQKDAQQAIVLTRMVEDLALNINLRVCPILREQDGLALSSRNRYLSREEREQAPGLSRALGRAESLFLEGERGARVLRDAVREELGRLPLFTPEYVELVDLGTLLPVERVESKALLLLAGRLGRTRLIDNIVLGGTYVDLGTQE